jgi:hypothetical protein
VKTMFIDQASSIVGVCVVYGINSLVYSFNCLYKHLIHEEQRREDKKEERNTLKIEYKAQREKEQVGSKI